MHIDWLKMNDFENWILIFCFCLFDVLGFQSTEYPNDDIVVGTSVWPDWPIHSFLPDNAHTNKDV